MIVPDERELTVLVAEDSAEVREIFSFALKESGYRVLEAKNGFEALVELEQAEVDIILTDLRMPQFDGIQLASTLKDSPRFRDIPIVALTATPLADLETMLGLFVKVLFKPCSVPQLISSIDEVAQRSR